MRVVAPPQRRTGEDRRNMRFLGTMSETMSVKIQMRVLLSTYGALADIKTTMDIAVRKLNDSTTLTVVALVNVKSDNNSLQENCLQPHVLICSAFCELN